MKSELRCVERTTERTLWTDQSLRIADNVDSLTSHKNALHMVLWMLKCSVCPKLHHFAKVCRDETYPSKTEEYSKNHREPRTIVTMTIESTPNQDNKYMRYKRLITALKVTLT